MKTHEWIRLTKEFDDVSVRTSSEDGILKNISVFATDDDGIIHPDQTIRINVQLDERFAWTISKWVGGKEYFLQLTPDELDILLERIELAKVEIVLERTKHLEK